MLSRIQDLRVVGGVMVWGRSTTNAETNNLPKIIPPGRGEVKPHIDQADSTTWVHPNISLQRAAFKSKGSLGSPKK